MKSTMTSSPTSEVPHDFMTITSVTRGWGAPMARCLRRPSAVPGRLVPLLLAFSVMTRTGSHVTENVAY